MKYLKLVLNIPTISRIKCLINTLLILVLSSGGFSSVAHEHKLNVKKTIASELLVEDAWARATFALASTGAAYFKATNIGDTPLVIMSVSVPQDIAMMAELHHTIVQNNMMKMQQLEDGVRVNAGEELEFLPGGKHIMIMGLKGPLVKGESITITMHFADGSRKTIEFAIVDKRNASHQTH